MRSLRVPGRVLERLVPLVKWALPWLTAAAIATYTWFRSRIDEEDVGRIVAPVSLAAQAAQADAHSAISVIPTHKQELEQLWAAIVMLRAELEVHRRYPSQAPATKGQLIEKAKKFYGDAYATERETRATDPPSKSAERAMRLEWRPVIER